MAGAIAVGAWAHLRLERFSAASLLLLTTAIPTATPTEPILTPHTPGTTAAIRTAGTTTDTAGAAAVVVEKTTPAQQQLVSPVLAATSCVAEQASAKDAMKLVDAM